MSESAASILLLEDSAFDADLIQEHLARIEPMPDIKRTVQRRDYVDALERNRFDVILADFSLPGFDGMSALEIAKDIAPETPFIFVSGVLGEEIAIDSFRKGATDYVLKQRLIRLPSAVERAVAERRSREERRRVEEQKELLVRELSHRVKNTLAVVMSIARRTAKSSLSIADFEGRLVSRLQAMSDAHALLFEANWSDTRLDLVLERILRAHRREGSGAFVMDGPAVTLDPKEALALGMIFHELATNAAKYGALSSPSGQVIIGWSVGGNGESTTVTVEWREEGGPAVVAPKEQGFGTTLIERSVSHELGGTVTFDYAPKGMSCRLAFPGTQL
ncbi:sensor histidine kinase [Pararhizobium haloflavum]|uniref:sensor histidine kinase n=1 Tax=Pararhizobium haloflavum TaxID=2037914 RepID=UPI000C19ABA8|nr:HWE histidine kinase domain-containing protein [Pararhizobium haloflavum]